MTTAIKITPAGEIDTIRIDELPDYQREIGGWVAELRLTNGHALLVDEEAGLKVTEPNLLASLYLTEHGRSALLFSTALIVGLHPRTGEWIDVAPDVDEQLRAIAAHIRGATSPKAGSTPVYTRWPRSRKPPREQSSSTSTTQHPSPQHASRSGCSPATTASPSTAPWSTRWHWSASPPSPPR